jgi:NAD(P)-dependent dehydrogenase (short-subunit alcohol dehydrogenase family)
MRTVLVTGANKGIGHEVARQLGSEAQFRERRNGNPSASEEWRGGNVYFARRFRSGKHWQRCALCFCRRPEPFRGV